MANITNLLAKLNVTSKATIQFTDTDTFASNPLEGQLCFKDQILYVWATINNISTWFPLTTIRYNYIHIQGSPATTWTVQHDLGNQNVIFMVYDDSDTVQTVNRGNVTTNSFTITFTESMAGKCVVFTTREADVPFIMGSMFERTEAGDDIIIYGNLIPSADNTWDIGSSLSSWKDMHLANSSLYIGNRLFVNGNSIVMTAPDATTSAEQPTINSSRLYMEEYSYDDGSPQLIAPMITSDAQLSVGSNSNPFNQHINAGALKNFTVTAANFSIDETGNMDFSGSITIAGVDGGTWT